LNSGSAGYAVKKSPKKIGSVKTYSAYSAKLSDTRVVTNLLNTSLSSKFINLSWITQTTSCLHNLNFWK